MNKNSERIKNLVLLALLSALIVGLQFVAGIRIATFTITLSLIPIVFGAVVRGPYFGAILGFVLGLTVSLFSVFGLDPEGQVVFATNPIIAWTLCLLKSTAAGFISGVIYRALKGKKVAPYIASMIAPVVNTGIFIIGMLFFFRPLLESGADGQNILVYILITVAGVNFLIEFTVSVLFAPALASIIKAIGSDKKNDQVGIIEGSSEQPEE